MPPRHGKSLLISQYFPAWFLLVYPWKRVILCSYEADFAAQWGRKVRDVVAEWGGLFGVQVASDSKAADRWEIARHGGGMQTAGVGGAILGKGADVLILDDLTKNAQEALSPTHRAKAWDWLTSTAFTRMEPGGRVVNVQQRWHTEDVTGQLIANDPDRWEVLTLPALAGPDDPLGRPEGAALWPERYPAEDLLARQKLAPKWFAAQYQQRPLDLTGGFFRGLEKVPIVGAAPTPDQFTSVCRFWDLASTEDQAGADPDWTAGTLIGKHTDGTFWVLDVRRERLGPQGVRALIRQTAQADGVAVKVRLEREGGASGKLAADSIVREDLAGFAAAAVKPRGNKAERAEPFAAQVEAGNVRLVAGEWVRPWLDEFRAFPTGKHDDMVDSASGGFAEVARPGVAVTTVEF